MLKQVQNHCFALLRVLIAGNGTTEMYIAGKYCALQFPPPPLPQDDNDFRKKDRGKPAVEQKKIKKKLNKKERLEWPWYVIYTNVFDLYCQ